MKLLLHICCAPCSIMCVETLREEGLEPIGFWNNPNIHPFTEYRSRKSTLIDYAKSIHMELVTPGEYGLRPFVQAVAADIDGRCAYCYETRMEAAAQYAEENGFSHFSSTLFISPYQNHELLKQKAEEAAFRHHVELLYRDFRPYFREGQNRARELGLYMQKYCGCVFSEEERYAKRKKKAVEEER
ncbi:MAG: epoxyqueuosine reductase QueH [Eubacteriales bacterium]|nr:epoxyqueuosine reductase QueH [Eubacteriales bacterium]